MQGDLRIKDGVERGDGFEITVDGTPVLAFPGETVAGALLASGRYALRLTSRLGSPRGVFCGIGHCHDCRVTLDGRPNQRACLALARPGCQVITMTPASVSSQLE